MIGVNMTGINLKKKIIRLMEQNKGKTNKIVTLLNIKSKLGTHLNK